MDKRPKQGKKPHQRRRGGKHTQIYHYEDEDPRPIVTITLRRLGREDCFGRFVQRGVSPEAGRTSEPQHVYEQGIYEPKPGGPEGGSSNALGGLG